MEKIKVNMSPNPLDVQAIHASQNDGEARQWEFELHNNGDAIDSSSISDQLVFKVYEGGTEEILPENGSTPTTSPFNGDIRYPQGLLTDQEFTYRESPTESDGLAKITDIKGNTIVWNQLVPTDWISTRTFSDGLSVTNNNDGSYTINGTATASRFPTRNTEIYGIQGHKYYIQLLSSQSKAVLTQTQSTVYVSSSAIYTAQNNNTFVLYFNANTYSNEKIIPMVIDLTQMGLDISSPSDFTSLFSLPYYSYNQGSLLSFNGNGIKTVGFNQWDEEWEVGNWRSSDGQSGSLTDRIRSKNYIEVFPNTDYYFKSPVGIFTSICWYDESHAFISSTGGTSSSVNTVFKSPVNAKYMRFNMNEVYGTVYKNDICINISSADLNGKYEPYTSSTLSLPISTYFPTGMKSAGNVYDELTESKAITRIGSVDLGTLSWNHITSGSNGYWQATTGSIPNAKYISNYSGINIKGINPIDGSVIQSVGVFQMDGGTVSKIGIAQNGSANYQNASATVAPTGILYYELATETETSFTTASLVTENAEIPLSNEDGVLIGKCTEQLSENPGFIDAKIKLADSDGECYSNKIQLHVERSPQ